jgi:signal transduction histidine kinase
MLVNRFAVEIRRRATEYRSLAEQMAETNRRLAQVQEEARRSERLAALGQMSAGLAHEIRNPLGVIKGSAEMLNQKLQQSKNLARFARQLRGIGAKGSRDKGKEIILDPLPLCPLAP